MKALEIKGYLWRGDLGARSLFVEDQNANVECDCEEVPIVGRVAVNRHNSDVADIVADPIVGTVPVGQPISAEENLVGEVLIEKGVVRNGRFLALEVEGDSMVNADILEGDMVIARQQPVAESSDIVVAFLGDEATVNRLYWN